MSCSSVAEAVKELWYWQYGTNPTNFTSRLFDLFQKADRGNQTLLACAFPNEWNAFMLWNTAPNEKEFFSKYGIDVAKEVHYPKTVEARAVYADDARVVKVEPKE